MSGNHNIFDQLQPGQRVTIFKFSEFGFPYALQTTICSVEYQDYAQYRNIPHIYHKPKGKQKHYVLRITGYESLLVWDGWQDVDVDMYQSSSVSGDITIRQTLRSFDSRYFDLAIQQCKQEPLIYFNTPDDIINRYTIKDKNIIEELEKIAENNGGKINEIHFNKYGLTPRHIKETFAGRYYPEMN